MFEMYLPDNVQCTYFFLFNIYYSVDNTYWRAKPNQKSVNQENRQPSFWMFEHQYCKCDVTPKKLTKNVSSFIINIAITLFVMYHLCHKPKEFSQIVRNRLICSIIFNNIPP